MTKSIIFSSILILCSLLTFEVKANPSKIQSEPADDFVGTYAAHDTTITYDGGGNITATNIRDYLFSITKIDSNHVQISNLDDCTGVLKFTVNVNTFSWDANQMGTGNCHPYCMQNKGDKVGNVLYYHIVKCFGAPIEIHFKGIATKISTNIDKPLLNVLTIFPNPSKEKVTFRFAKEQAGSALISCVDMMGKLFIQEKVNFSQEGIEIEVNNFPSGIYFFDIQTESNHYREKVIIYGDKY